MRRTESPITTSVPAGDAANPWSIGLRLLAGCTLGGIIMWFLFRGSDWNAIWEAAAAANVYWLLGTQLCLVTVCFGRAIRWFAIVRSAESTPFRTVFSATQMGQLANFLIPGRLGEVIRAGVLSRLGNLPFLHAFATVAIDRVYDVFALVLLLFISLLAFQAPEEVVIPASLFNRARDFTFDPAVLNRIANSFVLFLAAVLVVLTLVLGCRGLLLRVLDRSFARWKPLRDRLASFLDQFMRGLHTLRNPRAALAALAADLGLWSLLALACYCNLKAFDVAFPWFTPVMMIAFISAFGVVPGPPGRFGQYHLPAVVALVLAVPEVDMAVAKSFAIVTHLLGLVPIVGLGLFTLVWEQERLRKRVGIEPSSGEG